MFSEPKKDPSQVKAWPTLYVLGHQLDHHQAITEQLATTHNLHLTANSHNPDVHWFDFSESSVGIETVRDLQQLVSFKPYQGQSQWYVLLHLDQASLPAQNALLKLLEEPPVATFMILSVTSLTPLLPTIQSRCHIIVVGEQNQNFESDENFKLIYQSIITKNYGQLVTLAEKYPTKETAMELVTGLIGTLHHQLQLTPTGVFTTHLQLLLTAHRLLVQNVNPRLVIEDCFFSLLRTSATTPK